MREAGFNAGLTQRAIVDLPDQLLPVVLLLKNGDAAILVQRQRQAGGLVACQVVLPGLEPQDLVASEAELSAEYSGMALVATPQQQAASATAPITNEDPATLRDPSSHWLWGTVKRFVPYYRAALLGALLSNTLMLAIGTITSVIYDKVIPHQAFVTLWALAIAGGLALCFDLAARSLRAHLIDPGRQEGRPTGGHLAVPPEPGRAHGKPPRLSRRLCPHRRPDRAGCASSSRRPPCRRCPTCRSSSSTSA